MTTHKTLSRMARTLVFIFTVFVMGLVQASPDWVSTETKSYIASHPDAASTIAAGKSSKLAANARIHIVVSLRLRHERELDALINGGAAEDSAHSHTSNQFDEQYTPTKEDADTVVAYLKACGFSHIQKTQNRLLVIADGEPRAVECAFHTELVQFFKNGKSVFVNVSDAMVPTSLSRIILAVEGLQNADRLHVLTRPPLKAAAAPAASL